VSILLEYELEDDNGTVYRLASDQRMALEVSGLGMPPIRRWTTRSPRQDGVTHWGFAVAPRIVDIIIANKSCDRGGMYEDRRANVDMLSPYNSPLVFRLRVPNRNLVYELRDGWYAGGYELSSTDQSMGDGGGWNQVGSPSIQFDDPIWKWVNSPLGGSETRDADGRTCLADNTWTSTPSLTLPFTPPYLLGATSATNVLTCTNDGSWSTKPLITVEGPIEDWIISNATSGHILMWDGYSIATGEVITIDIRARTCTSSVATPADVSAYLTGDTGSFALDPGANTVNVYGSDGVVNATTEIGICWFVEFLGT